MTSLFQTDYSQPNVTSSHIIVWVLPCIRVYLAVVVGYQDVLPHAIFLLIIYEALLFDLFLLSYSTPDFGVLIPQNALLKHMYSAMQNAPINMYVFPALCVIQDIFILLL